MAVYHGGVAVVYVMKAPNDLGNERRATEKI